MKHKRFDLFLLFLLFFAFLSVSCTNGVHDVLYYQNSAASVTGRLLTDTGEFYVKITLPEASPQPEEEQSLLLRDMKIEFSYPEEACGYALELSCGNITASFGGLTVPAEYGAYERLCEIAGLFSISEETLLSVNKEEDGGMAVYFSDGCYVKFPPSSSIPCEIGKEGGAILIIDGYFLT